jgi:hypothetical protein
MMTVHVRACPHMCERAQARVEFSSTQATQFSSLKFVWSSELLLNLPLILV